MGPNPTYIVAIEKLLTKRENELSQGGVVLPCFAFSVPKCADVSHVMKNP